MAILKFDARLNLTVKKEWVLLWLSDDCYDSLRGIKKLDNCEYS